MARVADMSVEVATSSKHAVVGITLHASKITGVICGVRIEEIKASQMRKIRCLDKLVDELAKGRPMETILREQGRSPKSTQHSEKRSAIRAKSATSRALHLGGSRCNHTRPHVDGAEPRQVHLQGERVAAERRRLGGI